ncbi:hypothetical protein ABTK76_19355, partial [Acinetobacter baumannii]
TTHEAAVAAQQALAAGAAAPAVVARADRAGGQATGKRAGLARACPGPRELHGRAADRAQALRGPGRQHDQAAAGTAGRPPAGAAAAVVSGL